MFGKQSWSTLVALTLVLCLSAACGDLQPPGNDDDTTPLESRVTVTDEGDGVHRLEVDAHAEDAWIYFDLETRKQIVPADPADDRTWDLAFQRFHIRTNGAVARLDGADFDALVTAPADGYLVDEDDSDDEGTDPDFAFLKGDAWYAYDLASHKLTARDVVFVVRTPEGNHFKVRMLGYYDAAGSSGHPSLLFAQVANPDGDDEEEPADEITVDATSSTDWAFLRLDDGRAVAGDESAWDIAIQRTSIRTNGGTSGDGFGAARIADSSSFDDVLAASTFGFVADSMQPKAGPPGSGEVSQNAVLSDWFDYDMGTHKLTPKDLVFLVRTSSGGYAKLQVVEYASGVFRLRIAPVERLVEARQLTIDAADGAAWTAISLRDGAVVEVDELADSSGWDIAFSRTKVRANGGTSGSGDAAAQDTGLADFAALTDAPVDGWVEDSLSAPRPGAAEESLNGALTAWFDYDMTTHKPTPKATTYAVRCADGSLAKLQVNAWDGDAGQFQITVAYAGPGFTSF